MIIEIDMQSSQPIYEQLRDQIVCGIASKRLVPDEGLPSVRRLAAELRINFHTVNNVSSSIKQAKQSSFRNEEKVFWARKSKQ